MSTLNADRAVWRALRSRRHCVSGLEAPLEVTQGAFKDRDFNRTRLFPPLYDDCY